MKKRQAWLSSPMAFPRIVPHSDGAGVIEAVGPGADQDRVGRRVWVHGAQSYRPLGSAAHATVVPQAPAVDFPDAVGDELGACLGIPGITAHRAVFADGPVSGQTVLVHGVRGSVSSLAAQLARRAGATVIGTVRADAETGLVDAGTADHVVSLRSGPAAAIRRLAPDGADRVLLGVQLSMRIPAPFLPFGSQTGSQTTEVQPCGLKGPGQCRYAGDPRCTTDPDTLAT
jgi:NADPH2:quinone reductase